MQVNVTQVICQLFPFFFLLLSLKKSTPLVKTLIACKFTETEKNHLTRCDNDYAFEKFDLILVYLFT